MSRAFIFTTDSFLAIIICAFIAVSAVSFSARFADPIDRPRALEETGRDFLSALERNGTLEEAAVVGTDSGLTAALNQLPSTYCANLQLYENDSVVMQVNRTGCMCATELVVGYRTFLARNESAEREMFARFGGCFS